MAQFEDENTVLTPPVSPRDHIQGPDNAPVTLAEFGDFECPYCGQAYYVVKEIQRRLGDQMRYVFRNFPLVQVHPHAEMAAEAAESAAAQDRYWPMFDMLFEHQDKLDEAHLILYAADLNLNTKKFVFDVENHVYLPRIQEDILSGELSGVEGTPTFFINGVKYSGLVDLPHLLAAIESRVSV